MSEWTLQPEHPKEGQPVTVLCGSNLVCGITHPYIQDIRRLEQIVTACNAFESLRDVCEAIYKECDGICPPNIGIEIWDKLEAALAAAGVKE